MEEVLEQLLKECQISKFGKIREACLQAKEVLESQSSLLQCSPSELRITCFLALQDALETKQSRMVSLAVSGFHKLLRDNQFYSGYEDSDEENWLPSQLLTALESLPQHSEDIQVELLKVLLSMSCVPQITLSGHLVVQIVSICGVAHGKGNPAMRSASQSAAVQAIVALLNQIGQECVGQQQSSVSSKGSGAEFLKEHGIYDYVAPAFDELVPVINFLAEKLTDANKHRECKKEVEIPALFLLECTSSLLQGLSSSDESARTSYYRHQLEDSSGYRVPAYCSTLLVSALWQHLCPALIALLGTPVSMRVIRGTGRTQGQMGRGSGISTLPSQLFSSQEAKAIYNVACNLVVATGTAGEMRPVLESLFHRMLLYPPPNCRLDALRAVGELLRSPSKLIQLAGPILHTDPRNHYQCDLALFRFVMDSLMECSNCSDHALQMIIMDCISGLLNSLEVICDGEVLPAQQVKAIHDMYTKLEDVDYMGPVTYDSHINLPVFEVAESVSSDEMSTLPETFSQHSGEDEEQELKVAEEVINKDDNPTSEAEDETRYEEESVSDIESNSTCSGDTEGPEDQTEEQKNLGVCEAMQKQLEEEEDMRLLRLSQNIGSEMNIRSVKDEEQERECANARHFSVTLKALLPSLLTIRSTIEVDEAVLEFSSKYCQGVFNYSSEDRKCPIIINADGIYLATFAALSLNLKLIQSGFYCNSDKTVVLTQDQFIQNVFASGVLVYLSSSWVGELYNQVITDSFLQRAGYNPHSPYNCALVNLLTDLDGLGSIEQASQMLSDYRRLVRTVGSNPKSESGEAGRKLCRRILTCCWESVISILGTLLKYLEGDGGILAPVRLLLLGDSARKDEARRGQDMLILCLNSLQSTARLANLLGLQKRCGIVFSLLSSACLPEDERNPLSTPPHKSFRSPSLTKKPLRLHRAHILSFSVMMSSGLELGSHAPDCWSHLFRCCLYLSELERKFFSSTVSTASFGGNALTNHLASRKERLGCNSSDDFLSDDIHNILPPTQPIPPDVCIDDLIQECEGDISSSGFLSSQLSGKALCSLTSLVDKFFDSAATQLNLAALLSFLRELCEASQTQLFNRIKPFTPKRSILGWPRKMKSSGSSSCSSLGFMEDILLLHRVGETMLKVIRSGRPLIHIMRLWAVAGPHFLEAACHKDGAVSKKAISCIHDVVNSLLGSQTELPHFHFNEALFKPFENLLCLELCDIDVQDQIVNSICEFVESCSSEIRSGWRPLFGALRCVRALPVAPQSGFQMKHRGADSVGHETVGHLRAVKDVFEAFLATDNVLVFANAALDCILCLLKHVKGSGEGELVAETVVCWGELVGGDLCLDALRYIHRCAVILASMYKMSTSPVVLAHRITVHTAPHLVDPNIPGIDEGQLWILIDEILQIKRELVNFSCLWPETTGECEKVLRNIEEGSRVLQVWYVLLEGLAGCVITSPRRYQPQILDTLFTLMRTLHDCPGPAFGIYCINHLLLPLMQEWLRRSHDAQWPSWECAQSFKQYAGLMSDLVVDYINFAATEDRLKSDMSYHLMLQQCLVVLVECISYSSEVIARLGCSCIRHIALSCGDKLTPELWNILVCSICRASQVSLFPLYQLMRLFCANSFNFYGDEGQVKVAARRDCTGRESDRLRQLSHQVFLLDGQHNYSTSVEDSPDVEDRSFIFLLYTDSREDYSAKTDEEKLLDTPLRVSFRGLVVGLLANQMILQTLGLLLIEGSPHIVPSLANVLLQASNFSNESQMVGKGLEESEGKLPGLLKWMTVKQILILLDSLHICYEAAVQFDKRPGLKFLLQKVAQADKAANLYKQAGASWTLRMLTLFDLILSKVKHGLSLAQVKAVIDSETVQKKAMKNRAVEELLPSETQLPQRPTNLVGDDTQMFIFMLSQAFNDLCDAYLELITNRPGQGSLADIIDDQPIFFLTLPADEFPTAHRKNFDKWRNSLENFNKEYMEGRGINQTEGHAEKDLRYEGDSADICCSSSLPVKMTLGVSTSLIEGEKQNDIKDISSSSESEKKPFCFADLAHSYSSDDDSDEELDDDISFHTKGADSGVDSAAGMDQSIYSIATEKDISAMMVNYRRRKNRHSLPSQLKERRFNPFLESSPHQSLHAPESVPPEIEEQRTCSLMKDSEAHLKVWTEMVTTVFDLISQLKDCELRPLLPLVFPTMRSLTAHAHDPHLRQVVAEMLNRVACLYGFSPAE